MRSAKPHPVPLILPYSPTNPGPMAARTQSESDSSARPPMGRREKYQGPEVGSAIHSLTCPDARLYNSRRVCAPLRPPHRPATTICCSPKPSTTPNPPSPSLPLPLPTSRVRPASHPSSAPLPTSPPKMSAAASPGGMQNGNGNGAGQVAPGAACFMHVCPLRVDRGKRQITT